MSKRNVAKRLLIPRNANGIQMPRISAIAPLRKRKTVPPPSCNVNVYPNVFPSFDSCVASEINENNAGNVKKLEIPKRNIMAMIKGIEGVRMILMLLNPVKR